MRRNYLSIKHEIDTVLKDLDGLRYDEWIQEAVSRMQIPELISVSENSISVMYRGVVRCTRIGRLHEMRPFASKQDFLLILKTVKNKSAISKYIAEWKLEVDLFKNQWSEYCQTNAIPAKSLIKYQGVIEQLQYPVFLEIKSEENLYIFQLPNGGLHKIVHLRPDSRCFTSSRAMRGLVSAMASLMSGKKQKAVTQTALDRRMPNGEYRGIDRTMETRRKNGTNDVIARKVALARRMPDGTFKGADKSFLNHSFNNGRRGRLVPYQTKCGAWICLRSGFEWCVAAWLDDQSLNWSYEPCYINRYGHYYFPDFFVQGIGLVEVKPIFWTSEVKNNPLIQDLNILVINDTHESIKKYYGQAKRNFLDGKNYFPVFGRTGTCFRYMYDEKSQLYCRK